eukprot:147113-Chlamydomonas_euryale.AAC.1
MVRGCRAQLGARANAAGSCTGVGHDACINMEAMHGEEEREGGRMIAVRAVERPQEAPGGRPC